MRLLVGAGTAGLAICVLATPAAALPVLEEADAVELANSLAEATAEQDICYGWQVRVDDQGGGASGIDAGSNLGPTTPVDPAACDRYVVFDADIVYTSELSDREDAAAFTVLSNIAGAPGAAELREVGISTAALLGDDDDAEVGDAVLALPALVAAEGLAPFVPAEPNTGTIPAADGPTGSPGQSDWLRQNGAGVLGGGALIVAGLGWAAWSAFGATRTTGTTSTTRSPDGPLHRPRW